MTILTLSDRGVDSHQVPIPALLAVAGLHHHLIRQGTRTRVGLVVESGELREVHHFAAYRCRGPAINPHSHTSGWPIWSAGLLEDLTGRGGKTYNKSRSRGGQGDVQDGISTSSPYRGAQIFRPWGSTRR